MAAKRRTMPKMLLLMLTHFRETHHSGEFYSLPKACFDLLRKPEIGDALAPPAPPTSAFPKA